MGQALIEVFLGVATSLVSVILIPIDLIFSSLFPNLTSYINNFNNVLTTYVTPISGYFISMLPPISRSLFFIYIDFLVLLGTALLTYRAIILVFKIINKIKFW